MQGEEQQEGEESQREERMENPAALRRGQDTLQSQLKGRW